VRSTLRILVVDDEPSMQEMLGIMLQREGYEVTVVGSRAEAARALARGPADMVITDIKLPDGDGLEILRHVRSAAPETSVIVMTAYGSAQTAVAALKMGAHDYLIKPFDIDELKIVVRSALEKQRLEAENLLLKAEFRSQHALDRIIGVSPAMAGVFSLVRTVAPTASTVLLSGESGTGKELVAKAIHALSPRKDGPFISVNCGALTETLLESELFGHMKGAFTDAYQSRRGLFEAANRGTLMLDEIGETSPSMQVKLLRALQERKVRRVGGTDEVNVDVRVIAATNQPLEELVQVGRFREDLFYRINVIPIRIPPLRERREDVPLLAEHFLKRVSQEMGKQVQRISADAMTRLTHHSWPGNVRELENVIERAAIVATGRVITTADLPESFRTGRPVEAEPTVEIKIGTPLDEVKKTMLRETLKYTGGHKTRAARLLGIDRKTLYGNL
jgi:two-component system response regulator PilR (NtrC family)